MTVFLSPVLSPLNMVLLILILDIDLVLSIGIALRKVYILWCSLIVTLTVLVGDGLRLCHGVLLVLLVEGHVGLSMVLLVV